VKSLFITGGTGFVGRRLLQRLAAQKYKTLYCLSRAGRIVSPESPSIHALEGGLADIDRYQPELAACECVVHLAAATGKLKPADYFRINVVGTNNLIERAKQCGVKRILFVSSIVVRYPIKDHYYYAQSKEQAEQLVRESGLDYAIVRPTIVAGEDSGVLEGLAKIASLPIVPVFGDGKTRVQPIAVGDLADFLALILERELFAGDIFEFGGPEVLTIEDLLKRLCRARLQREARVMHIAFALAAPLLKMLERVAYSMLPVTLGQLAIFRCDGTAEPNSLFEERRAGLKPMAEMLGQRR
jgi:nucleoside-diphosphate-sugar epimerase